MQQQQQKQPSNHRYLRQQHHGGPVAYEEKTRVLDFASEDDQDEDGVTSSRAFTQPRNGQAQMMATRQSERHSLGINSSARSYDATDSEDDGRQRSRVKTRPVVGTRATDLADISGHRRQQYVTHHQAVRTRPVSAAPIVSNYTTSSGGLHVDNKLYQEHRPMSQQVAQSPPPPATVAVQSPVAKRVAAGKLRKKQVKQPEQQHPQPYQQYQSVSEAEYNRPRAGSESSFGGRLFFGWRRAQYEATAGQPNASNWTAALAHVEAQPSQYRGKNLHNFSYTDAKIYSPQSHYQQKENQQQQQQQRAKIWWTTGTQGAVNSAHNNQMLLQAARRQPEQAVKVQGDYF